MVTKTKIKSSNPVIREGAHINAKIFPDPASDRRLFHVTVGHLATVQGDMTNH